MVKEMGGLVEEMGAYAYVLWISPEIRGLWLQTEGKS